MIKSSLLASAQAFCYEMKVVQAFSWALFIGFILALYVLFQLVGQAQRFGRYLIWSEPIRGSKSEFKLLRWKLIFLLPLELPWFGEMPGYYNTHAGQPMYLPPSAGMGPGYFPPMTSAQGNTFVIQPGMNGQPPTIHAQ